MKANGLHSLSQPHWPAYTLSPAAGVYGTGQERIGESVETYTLSFHSKEGDNYQTTLTMPEWNLYNVHQTVYITTSFSTVTKIRSLEN